MHDTAMSFGEAFFRQYCKGRPGLRIVDIGSQDVNGSLRSVAPPDCEYVGIDFQHGNGVDVIMTDPYKIPLADGTADVCVSSSCYEHSEFFWLLFLEALRILKRGGLLYLNAPSNGLFHRYPVDCWRFYPDSGMALERWASRNLVPCTMLESFVGAQGLHGWNDFVAVFVKDDRASGFPNRIIDTNIKFTNGIVHGSSDLRNPSQAQEDQMRSALLAIAASARKAAKKNRSPEVAVEVLSAQACAPS